MPALKDQQTFDQASRNMVGGSNVHEFMKGWFEI